MQQKNLLYSIIALITYSIGAFFLSSQRTITINLSPGSTVKEFFITPLLPTTFIIITLILLITTIIKK